jgi:mannose/fructose/N-acetylgalactosamine-specific phosphotransferase system component IID
MYIVPIGWLYVALMMAIAEATSSSGSVLGGLITFVLYGLAPVVLVVYLMGAPARSRAIKAREAAAAQALIQPDAGSHATAASEGEAVAPVGKEP